LHIRTNHRIFDYRKQQGIFPESSLKTLSNMMTDKLQKELNVQIAAELWSANLYLSMHFYFLNEGLDGFAHWMRQQAAEETDHACQMAAYMAKRGGIPKLDKIDVVPQTWDSPLKAFEETYKHECRVSGMIDALVKTAAAENDNATQDFLWGFVREQVEEEATALSIVEKIKRAGDAGILFIDAQLGGRK
jgi:ferritin